MLSQVLLHWACAKISACSSLPDAPLKELLTEKLKKCPAVRFAALAAHAQVRGRLRVRCVLPSALRGKVACLCCRLRLGCMTHGTLVTWYF